MMPIRSLAIATLIALSGCVAQSAQSPAGDGVLDQRAEIVFNEAFAKARPELRARIVQDDVQKICTHYRNAPPASVRQQIEASQLATIRYPSSGRLIGDWKKGEKLAQDGYGLRFTDTTANRPNGGNCYACHQLAPAELSYGTLGPSLYHYGKLRGASKEILSYTYSKIYNPQAFAACSNMPRFGHHEVLTPEQIADAVALLLDPESPVNKN
jgi:L-cysteine S-thiosulfotransferase